MKTEVTLQRPFMGHFVEQKSKSGMFNLTKFVNLANLKRRELDKTTFNLSQFLKQKSTVIFIEELQKENEVVITKGRGRNSSTWAHPLLFIDMALAIDPKFKIEVYKWLMDELLKNRNDSGDSYRKMSGALYERIGQKAVFPKYIIRVANHIKTSLGVNDWNKATQNQLHLRDKIHENISLLCSVLTNPDDAVRIGVVKTLEDNKDIHVLS